MLSRLIAGLALALAFSTGALAKPLVVILGDSRGAEAADLLPPYAILAESGAVDVRVVSATAKPIRLTPGKAWIAPQMTLAEVDRGPRPDVIIIPALGVVEDPARTAWLREKARQGSHIMSICNGAKVLAETGLLEDRQATVHWFSQGRLRKKHPDVHWRRDVRWITDGPVTTTAGISAAEPASLDLLRRLAGDEVMRETAGRLRLPLPEQRHDGTAFRLTLGRMATVVLNKVAFWRREDIAVPVSAGFDEIAFGAAMDGWSRTYRSEAWAAAAPGTPSRHGLRVYGSAQPPARFDRSVALPDQDALAAVFRQIRGAYGPRTADFVAAQFEHPAGALPRRG